jgi:hypothetical protein
LKCIWFCCSGNIDGIDDDDDDDDDDDIGVNMTDNRDNGSD